MTKLSTEQRVDNRVNAIMREQNQREQLAKLKGVETMSDHDAHMMEAELVRREAIDTDVEQAIERIDRSYECELEAIINDLTTCKDDLDDIIGRMKSEYSEQNITEEGLEEQECDMFDRAQILFEKLDEEV